jgi:type VI protein secretion system component VasK
MKRQMGGGSHRGPLGLRRQRRTIRFTQFLLIAIAAGLLLFAGYSWGRSSGYEAGSRAGEIDAPRRPSAAQTIVLGVLGTGALAAALILQGGPETVRIPTPAKLDELAGRAEATAVQRAEKEASEPRA